MSIPAIPPAFSAAPAAPAAPAAAPAAPAAPATAAQSAALPPMVPTEQFLATAAELEITKRKFTLLAHAAHNTVSPQAAEHFVETYARRFDPAKPVGEQVQAWRAESPFYFREAPPAPAPAAPPAAPAAPGAPSAPPPAVGAPIPPAGPAPSIPPPDQLSRLSNAELDALIARKR